MAAVFVTIFPSMASLTGAICQNWIISMEVAPTMHRIIRHEIAIGGTWIHELCVFIASGRWEI
jgi:hypothetical protein